LACELRRVTAGAGATFLVNDRVDLALAVGADGVHLGRRSLPPSVVRLLLGGEETPVGASCHNESEAREATREGADFLFVGAIYPTPSHPGVAGAGAELITEVESAVPVPLVAIGGIRPEAVEELVKAGAHGVAVISGIWDAEDSENALKGYLRALPPAMVGGGRDGRDG
jgi:thiamine-phosphate pyrophosphorylase